MFGDVPNEPLSDVSETVGSRVRQVREGHRWSVEDVAARCAAAGAPQLTVHALYALESGRKEKGTGRRRRHITVDEFLVLAYVLGIHPVDLLVPASLISSAPYNIAPGVTTTAGRARNWIAGLGFIDDPETRNDLVKALQWMTADRADRIAEHWAPPRHVMDREAERIREQNAAIKAGEEAGLFVSYSPEDIERDEEKEREGGEDE